MSIATATPTPKPTCEARTGYAAGEWREVPLWCNGTVGLTTWTDANGREHRACRHHVPEDIKKRYYVRPLRPVIDRFLAFVKVGASPDDCWEWTGAKTNGYGTFRVEANRNTPAHRWSYEHYRGQIPAGLQLDHLCRNRACVNPAHLEAVTQTVNILRGNGWSGRKARQTHCIRGHEFTPANTRNERRDGRRSCRACYDDRLARLRQQNVVRRLMREDVPAPLPTLIAQPYVEPCFLCHKTRMVELGCYTRVTLGTGVVNLCDSCREKGDES